MTIAPTRDAYPVPDAAPSRRSFLAAGVTLGAGAALLMGSVPVARAAEAHEIKEYDVAANGITLHVTEMGEGEAVVFWHGFPDTAYTWRRQMQAVASAGYRAIAPDMRGYGRSSAPADAALYTPLQTTGDLVGLLDALKIPSAIIVGHDWGASIAWGAALMRPDRFKAVALATAIATRRYKDGAENVLGSWTFELSSLSRSRNGSREGLDEKSVRLPKSANPAVMESIVALGRASFWASV